MTAVVDILHSNGISYLESLQSKSIDLLLTDPPYSTKSNKLYTANPWDKPIDLNKFWTEAFRTIKDNGVILLFGNPPFSFELMNHEFAKKYYRYDWIWKKERGSNFQHANRQPMKVHEHIHVFYKKQPNYYPIKTDLDKVLVYKKQNRAKKTDGLTTSSASLVHPGGTYIGKFPTTILEFSRDRPMVHSTQKPVKLLSYLIRTYTKENDLIIDPFSGYGSTAIAAKQVGNRNCVTVELDQDWYEKSKIRLNNVES